MIQKKDAQWFEDIPRFKALQECLEGLSGRKVIIWTDFRPTYRAISEVVGRAKLSVAHLTGEQSAPEKQEAIDSFNLRDTQVLIANPAAGGVGVNLASAPYSIYFSRSYSLEHFLQSQARNYRGGSEIHDKVTHFHLVAPGTIDEVILDALSSKKSTGDALLEWARKKHLADAIGKRYVSPEEIRA